jgi:hypothetical protein
VKEEGAGWVDWRRAIDEERLAILGGSVWRREVWRRMDSCPKVFFLFVLSIIGVILSGEDTNYILCASSLPFFSSSVTSSATFSFWALSEAFTSTSCFSSSTFSWCSTMSGGSPTIARRNFSLVTCSR